MKLEGYNHFSNISCVKRGVLIYVSECLNTNPVETDVEFDENVWVEVKLEKGDKLLIGCIYRSPNSPESNNKKIMEGLKKMCDQKYSHVLICGDFNFPEINWSTETTTTNENHQAYRFLECYRDCFLSQHVVQPTHHRGDQRANVLDLIFSNEEEMITNLTHDAPLGASHHSTIKFLFQCYAEGRKNTKPTFVYSKGNYEEMKDILEQLDWEDILREKNCSESWDIFHGHMMKAMKQCIPKRGRNPGKPGRALWMNEEALAKVRKKSAAYKRYLETKEGKDYREYAKARNQARWASRRAKIEFEKKIAQESKTNPKSFYKYVNSKLKVKTGVAELDTDEGKASTNKEKAEVLNSFFTSVFTREDHETIPEARIREGVMPMTDFHVTEEDVLKKLKDLNPNKSSGPDELHPRVLKELSDSIAKPLTLIMRRSLDEGRVPQIWKDAHVTPIFKKGKKSKSNNYRPVSLTSVVCKIFESILRDNIMDHIEVNNILSKFQHGFVPRRSCSTQLVSCLEKWTEILDRGSSLDAIYLDFSKAFDSVPHQRLCAKLESYGIQGKVIKWIRQFLKDRRQKVVVNGEDSEWENVLSGVPQGSVLGPTLFVLFINDMPEVVSSFINMFADDAKVFTEVSNDAEHAGLQQDLNELLKWAKAWQMVFNAGKCKVMHLGSKNSKYEYQMGEVTLETTECEKDLGVWVDQDLKFTEHITQQVAKANKILGLIRRSFSTLNKHTFNLMYKSLVRTHLEYGNVICYPQYEKDAILLENVQRRATKFVPELRDKDYEERLRELNLPSLKYRRKRGDMIEVFKYTHGLYDIQPSPLPRDQNTITRGHLFKLEKSRSYKTLRQKFFTRRIVTTWNNLPDSVVEAPSVNSFKNRLDNHWKEQMFELPKLN